ncbi:MAG TPA: DNA translocase FtsK 4TM domain-containing protein, partial [Bacteroidota bacterium]|nr:DNA translocase FtsK 4TM domain-containing protein [Bacteroidota bacterium]
MARGNDTALQGKKMPRGSRRGAVAAILLMAAAALVLIALVTYDAGDESRINLRGSDLSGVLSGDPDVKAAADTVRNGLGLVGALLADALINDTVGYAVIVVPAILLFWGWTFLARRSIRSALVFSNYAITSALLVAASFGLVRLIADPGGPAREWYGIVGYAAATMLAQLLGKAGAAVVLLVALLLTAVLGADLDVHEIAGRIRDAALRLGQWLEERRVARLEARPETGRGAAVTITKPAPEQPLAEPAPVAPQAPPRVRTPAPAEEPRPIPVSVTVARPVREAKKGEAPPAGQETDGEIDYVFPSVDLLEAPKPGREDVDEEELKANADLLRATLAEFDVELESVSVTPGPVVTLYELVPASGVKISRIVSLENDMALKLAARGIRIMAPIPGKSAVGVEIPNSRRSLVTIRSVINSTAFREAKASLPLAMGKTIAGEVFTDDLAKMPHLLMAGSTGSGKSVGINTILASLLYRLHPSDLKLVVIDPKKIELAQYAALRHHFLAVSPDIDEQIVTTPGNAVVVLRSVEREMENRYDRLAAAGVRNIVDYNERLAAGRLKESEETPHAKMPFLIVVIDELADLMITAAREVEEPIARLAQLARAVGIHLIVATQRPSVDVITGVIKANFPARIAYQVASKTDSRTILDMNGAEQLLGNGDMLYLASGSPKPVRLQNAFISADEVEAVVGHIGAQEGYAHPFMLPPAAERRKNGEGGAEGERDELFEEAARLIVRHQQGSVSLLQR